MTLAAVASFPISAIADRTTIPTKNENKRALGNNHLMQVIRKDVEILKKGSVHLAESFHFTKIPETLQNIFWLRNFEDPKIDPAPPLQWPKPSYPGLTGTDLLMADIHALTVYAAYFRHVSQIWSLPLPQYYDPERVEQYFSCRPHVLAIRILEVFSSFSSAVIKIQTKEFFKFPGPGTNAIDDKRSSGYYVGQLMKETMLNLGPTFVKVGQSLSTRPDMIGPEISEALSELHDQVPPFPRTVAMSIIKEELGCPVQTAFSYLSEEPVAAASFGQVYYGCSFDGHTVAVKVQRPNMHHGVMRDVYILRLGLGLLQKIAKRKSDLRLYADEIGRGLTGELDYNMEAANATEFLEAHAQVSFISVPKVFKHLSGKRVLTMEWLIGENPKDLLALSKGFDHSEMECSQEKQMVARNHLFDLVNKGVEASLVQLLETGLLHADPHPGNLRYTPKGQIGFVDFGLMCRMEKKHQFAILASILHIVNGDWTALVQDLCEMDVVRPGINILRVTMELERSLGGTVYDQRDNDIPDIKLSRVLGKIWSVALKYHFRMPPYYTLLLRSLASLEGLALAADPDFKTFEAAYSYVVQKLLTDKSIATRRILHSVVFNKRKEIQWEKLQLFIKLGSTRKSLQTLTATGSETFTKTTAKGQSNVIEITSLVMSLLPSKKGAVLRRLLMTADGISLVNAMLSKEASFFREHVTQVTADILIQWMTRTLGRESVIDWKSSQPVAAHLRKQGSTAYVYLSLFNDRRMRVISFKLLNDMKKNRLLTIRFSWMLFLIMVSASFQACRQVLLSLIDTYFKPMMPLTLNKFARGL